MVLNGEEQTREYMISRAKACLLSGDSSYAKCWIMTANALFPRNDQIKFEAYQMCKCESNVEEATKYFCEMFTTVTQSDDRLMSEMRQIVISCRNEWQTYNHLTGEQIIAFVGANYKNETRNWSTFYNKLFASLSPQYQYQLLMRVVDNTDEKLILIDLLLFMLKKFPQSVTENGIKLIEIMNECEIKFSDNLADNSNVVNYLRKKLVFDVLPIIFSADNSVVIPNDTIQKLMQKTLKYFVEQLISTEKTESDDSHRVNANNNTNIESSDLETKIIGIFKLIGIKKEWQLFNNIDYSEERITNLESIYEKISHFIDEFRFQANTDSPIDLSSASTAKISGDEQTNQQILYSTLLLFLQCLRRYFTLSHDIVLIEQANAKYADSNMKLTLSASKKRKLQSHEPELFTSSNELKQVFVVASKALKLLNENMTINSEFTKLSEIIGLEKCQSFRAFLVDSNIYRAEYSKVIEILMQSQSLNLKSNIQLISVTLMLHDYSLSLKYCLDTIETLPPRLQTSHPNDSQAVISQDRQLFTSSLSRHLIFISLSVDDILNYVIDVIILCLKDRIMLSLKPSDAGIGHLIVLSQYNWPLHVKLFLICMSLMRNESKAHPLQSSQPKFVYHCFFNYVFIPDIIEEFMSLVELKEIQLELKPSNLSIGAPIKTSSKVITTRGVNKGVKEEIKSALISQMKASKTQISNELLIDFINKEIRTFVTSLNK